MNFIKKYYGNKKKNRQSFDAAPAISIVMPVYNCEKYISDAIESVLSQSFTDFEFIIIDDGSSDDTTKIIEAFDDKRIVFIKNNHDFMCPITIGVKMAVGKYIARMDGNDIMHPDRLKIQYHIMEMEPSIMVCSSWVELIVNDVYGSAAGKSLSGLIENPIVELLKGNMLFHSTIMFRKFFIENNNLECTTASYAEDYRLCVEMAKLGAKFYVESQALIYYRISNRQKSKLSADEQQEATGCIQREVLLYLISKNREFLPELSESYKSLSLLVEKELMTFNDLLVFFQNIFRRIKHD